MKKKFNILACLIFLSMLLAACGATATPTVPAATTPATAPTNTPVASLSTATAVVLPTTIPTVTPAPPPTGTPPSVSGTVAPTPTLVRTTPDPNAGGLGFKNFDFADAGFSIALPEAFTTQKKESTTTAIGMIDQYNFELVRGTTTYSVIATKYPQRYFERDDLAGLGELSKIQENLLKQYNPQRYQEIAVFIDQFPGRFHTLVVNNSFVKTRVYLVNSNVYQVTMRYVPTEKEEQDAEKFFQSFKPTAKPTDTTWSLRGVRASEFQVLLPDNPTASEKKEKVAAGEVTTLSYTVEQKDKGIRWTVKDTPFPTQVDTAQVLKEFRDKLISESKGKLNNERAIKYDKYNGLEVRVDLPNGGYLLSHMYVVGQQLYQVEMQTNTAISSPAQALPLVPGYTEIQRFFVAFDFARN